MASKRESTAKLLTGAAAGAGVAALVGLLQLAGWLELWELRSQDLRARWTLPAERASVDPHVRPDVTLVYVTDESLELASKHWKMSWPWDRQLYGLFFQACGRGGATAALFDVLVQEPGRDEAELVQALASAPPSFIGCQFWESRNSITKAERPDFEALLERYAVDVDNDGSVRVPDRYVHAYFPSPGVARAVSGACNVSTVQDEDGIIRRYALFTTFRNRYYPSFVLSALMAREKTRTVRVRKRTAVVGSVSIPLEEDGTYGLRWHPQGNVARWRSAYNVVNGMQAILDGEKGDFDPKEFQGNFVFFGVTASALGDVRVTPVSDRFPGPEVHATALAGALSGDILRRAPGPVSAAILLAAALLVALATRWSPALAGAAAAALAAAALVGVALLLYRGGWVVDLVAPLLAALLSYGAASALNFLYEGRQRLRIKREFQRYMSPKVVEKILRNPDALSLEGERKTLSVFFMDFAGFTSMSEKLDPAELVKLISEYHNEAAEEIFRTDGTVDKYIGDAIMAFWNDPIPQEDHALRACLSAIAAQRRLLHMAVKMKERGLPEMSARIGINTGIATVGNMGAKNQVNYTVIGDEVNLASRLEGVNKEFGTNIIVSESAWQPARERLEVRELALIKVKGKKLPVRIFELLGLKGEVPAERIEVARRFEEGLRLLRARDFAAAWDLFRDLVAKRDKPSATYFEVADRYLQEPPPSDWDGSYQMEHK
jgi:adenylate cyclase